MGDGVGRTRQRVWDRGARDARRSMLRMISAKGRRRSQRSSGKSGWVEEKTEMRWLLPVRTALSAGLDLWVCGGTNVTGNRCERKYSRHFSEVSLSTMRLGRG
jgi:hypothetical protein